MLTGVFGRNPPIGCNLSTQATTILLKRAPLKGHENAIKPKFEVKGAKK